MKIGRENVIRGLWSLIRSRYGFALGLFFFLTTVHGPQTTLAYAADVQISSALDRQQLALNEQAVLTVTVAGSGNLPAPQLPSLPDFQVYNAGRSQSFSWVNGQASASTTYSYVLTPLKEGHFKIPPVTVQANGQTVEAPELALDVVHGDPGAVPAPSPTPSTPRSAAASRARGPAAIRIQGSVDKTSVYVGEPVTYTFQLLNRVPLMSNPSYQPPETSGFWSEDLPPQRSYNSAVNGMAYNVTEVKTALFPTTPGKVKIGPASLSVRIENLAADPFSPDFFSSFFGHGEEKVLRTEPITIAVKPLPDPKPVGFKGAVGHYSMSSNLDKDSAAVGQPITLTVTISGRGNIKSLPDLDWPPFSNFRTFDANAATNIDKKNYQVTGSKVFKTVLIPTTSGDLPVAPVSFIFFDSDSHAYKTLTSRPFTVHVAPGSAGSGVMTPSTGGGTVSTSSPGIQRLAEDIRYIHTPSGVSSQNRPLYRQAWFWVLHLLGLLSVLGLGGYRLIHRLFLSDERQSRFKSAAARATQRRQQADQATDRQEFKNAAAHLSEGLRGYLADKLGLDERGLGLKDALQELKARGAHPHQGEKIRGLWETLDLFQFAPTQVRAEELRQASRLLENIVDGLEKEIVWKG